jgi:hypothetical protein
MFKTPEKHLKAKREKYKKYPWKRTLLNIKQRCTNPNNPKFKNYGARGIKVLITENELKELWFRDKAFELNHPSIDRKDNDGDYIFNNCRYIERNKNKCLSKIKKICQYTEDGKLVKIWNSISEIEKELKLSIGNISTGIKYNRKRFGYYWRIL